MTDPMIELRIVMRASISRVSLALPVVSRGASAHSSRTPAAAVCTAVERWPGARITLCNRTPARAETLAARFPVVDRIAARPADAVHECTVVVNATPDGMADDTVPVDVALFPAAVGVIDLVHRTGDTTWVRDAKARGLRAGDGLAMLVEQGALAFERWFGIVAPRDVMWEAACNP